MAIKLPKYEELTRQPMPGTTPLYPRVGERWQIEERYFQKTRGLKGAEMSLARRGLELQRRGIESSRRYARTQLALNLVNIGADLFTKFGTMWAENAQKVKTAETTAQVNAATMETVKEFTDLLGRLNTSQVSEEFLDQQAMTGIAEEQSTYRNWYVSEAEKLYLDTLERHKTGIVDQKGQAAYEEWLSNYYAENYGRFATAGLDRDARIANESAHQSLRDATEMKDWHLADAIIATNVLSGTWSQSYAEHLRGTLIPQIKMEKAMQDARALGLSGPAFLVSDAAMELYDITPEQANQLAAQLAKEEQNKQTFEFMKNRDKILEDFDRAIDDIYSDKLNPDTINQLRDREKYYLDPSHQDQAMKIYQERMNEQQESLNEYKEERFSFIEKLIDAGDLELAQKELNNLSQVKGIVLGPADKTDFDRLQWMIENAGKPDERDEFTQRVLDFEKELGHKTATWAGFDEFVAFVEEGDFGERGEAKVAHFREQLEQLDRWRAGQAEEKYRQQQAKAPTDQFYWDRYNDVMERNRETHTVDQLLDLKAEISDTIGPDPATGEQRIKTTDARTMFNAINRRIDELRSGAHKELQAQLKAGREFINSWYDQEIKEKRQQIEGAYFRRKKEQLQVELADLHAERQRMLEQYETAAPQGDDPVETAKQLLLPEQRIKVRDSLSGERRIESDREYYERVGTPELHFRTESMYAPPEGLTPEEITGPMAPSVLESRRIRSGAASPEQQLRMAKQIRRDNEIISRFNNYLRAPNGIELAASKVYNNQEAPPFKYWVYNKATNQVELAELWELWDFKGALIRRAMTPEVLQSMMFEKGWYYNPQYYNPPTGEVSREAEEPPTE